MISMKLSIIVFIITFVSFDVFCQTKKLDFAGLKVTEKKNDYGVMAKYYDQRDSLVYEVQYNSEKKIVNGTYDLAVTQNIRDGNGHNVETRYLNESLKLMRVDGGPAIIRRKFDGSHRLVEESNHDEKGSLLRSNFSVVQFKYDNKGCLVEETDLNQLRVPSGKNPIKKYKCDEKGRRIEESLFDAAGKMLKTGNDIRHSITRFAYSLDNKLIQKTFLTETGEMINEKPVVKIAYDKKPPMRTSVDSFDPDPQWIEYTYFDKDGNEVDKDYRYVPRVEN